MSTGPRYLVAESAVLVGGVLGHEVSAGENWAYLDVGAHNWLTETQQTVNQGRYPLWSSRPDHAAADQVPFTVTGPSCDSSDTTCLGVFLPATLDAGTGCTSARPAPPRWPGWSATICPRRWPGTGASGG
jgi:ornithine decarboxylase